MNDQQTPVINKHPENYEDWLTTIDGTTSIRELVMLEKKFLKNTTVVAPELIQPLSERFEKRFKELGPIAW